MLERARLVDHPELEGAGVRFDGNPAGVAQHDEKERHRGEKVSRVDGLAQRGADRGGLEVRQIRGGHEGDGEGDEQDRGLDERPECHGSAAAELGVGPSGLEGRQGDGEARQGEDEASAQDVAHVTERKWVLGQDRNEERHREIARKGNHWPSQEDPARVLRDKGLFAKELPDVVVRLEDPRTPAALQSRL